MFIAVRILVLYGLVQLLVVTEKPLLCAAIYAVVGAVLGLTMSMPLPTVLLRGFIALVLGFVYFWLLSRMERGSLMWYVVLAGGLLVGLV